MDINISYHRNTKFDHVLSEKQVAEGLDFILSHFNDSIWPRTISTKLTEGRQITIYSKLEAMSYYKDSDYLDCRISAYRYSQNAIPVISLLMIDLDLGKFNFNIKMLDLAKAKILTNIKTIFSTDFEPTILAS